MQILKVLAAVAVTAFVAQPPSPTPSIPVALARIQANDFAGAITILETVTEREPKNGRAWRVLAVAHKGAKSYDAALAALRKSLEVDPDNPAALYNMGAVYALQGESERAFEWLGKAKTTRKLDMTQLDGDADLASLKADARFGALRPRPEDFANPFVEPVTILREWDGEASHDQFGWIARNIGDVDGDGVPDIVTSAPTKAIGGANAGRIYVYSTKSGKLLWSADGHPGDQLGTGIEAAGDTNRDGVPDVIAAAPGGGYANVYSGKDGRVLFIVKAEGSGDNFGQHASGAGDVNHDGYADVIVGAPGNKAGGEGAGRAYVFSGKDGTLLLTLTGERANDGFGSSVTGYADKDRIILVVGAPGAGDKHAGRTYVYNALSQKPQFVIDADETGNALVGMFVSVPGDVDGDGVPDVYASDWSNTAKGQSTGRVYVHSGKDGHLMKTFTCRIPGDTFGFDAVTMGDVDGDGTSDFLITSAWSGIHGFHSGRIFIISSGIRQQLASL